MNKQPAYDLVDLRENFEITRSGIAYLNHAGMAPLPAPARTAMHAAVDAMAFHGSEIYSTITDPVLQEALNSVGLLVNAKPDEISFVQNTSTGINIIARSLPWEPGDEILLCDTEFPSNVYPWLNLAATSDINVRFLPTVNGGVDVNLLAESLSDQTRLVAVSGIQFFSGRKEKLSQIGSLCQKAGIWMVVDAMQMAGIAPIDMKAMGIHALAAGGQKALCGPPGFGFFAVQDELIEVMKPVFAGPHSVAAPHKWLQYDLTPARSARRFDTGTTNAAGLVGFNAAVKLLLSLGIDNILDWVSHLSSMVIADLTDRGYRIATPISTGDYAHIITFEWAGDPFKAVAYLKERGIILREHFSKDGRAHLRISSHCYNTEEEVLLVGQTLEEIR